MKKILFLAIGSAVLAGLLFGVRSVSAQTTTIIKIGDYQVEIGWLTVPPIAGQQNGIVVNVSESDDPDPEDSGTIDVSALKVDLVYGSETKTLTLRPLGENTYGQFVAPVLPARPGLYTVRLSGNLGDLKNISGEVQPEKVLATSVLQFPPAANPPPQTAAFGLVGWLAVVGLLTGLAGLLVAVMTLRKNRQPGNNRKA
jgi:hypothetical protein